MEKRACAVWMSSLLCLSVSMGLIAFTIPGWFVWEDFQPFESQKHLYYYDYFSLMDLITQNEDMLHDSIQNSEADFKKGEIVSSISWWATNAQNLLDDNKQTFFLDMYQFRQEFCDCDGCDIFRNYDKWYDDFCTVCDQWVAGSVATAVLTSIFFVFGCLAMFMPVFHTKKFARHLPCRKTIGSGACVHLALSFMTVAFIIYTCVLYSVEYNQEIRNLKTIAGGSVYEGSFCFMWIAYLFYCCGYRKKFHDWKDKTENNEEH